MRHRQPHRRTASIHAHALGNDSLSGSFCNHRPTPAVAVAAGVFRQPTAAATISNSHDSHNGAIIALIAIAATPTKTHHKHKAQRMPVADLTTGIRCIATKQLGTCASHRQRRCTRSSAVCKPLRPTGRESPWRDVPRRLPPRLMGSPHSSSSSS